MTILNSLFEDQGTLPGTAAGWSFTSNCPTVVVDPAGFCAGPGYPTLDGVDTGYTGSQFQMGRENDSEIVYTNDDVFTRTISQTTGTIPEFANSIDVRFHKKLHADADAATWALEVWVAGVLEHTEAIEPGDDSTIDHSVDVTAHRSTEILVELKLTQQAKLQVGDFAFASIQQRDIEYAGFAEKDEATPTTTTKVNPSATNVDFGVLSVYEDGQPLFFRYLASADSARARPFARDSAGNFYLCGTGGASGTQVVVEDEAGAVLGTTTKPAGISGNYSYYMKFSPDGTLLWLQPVTWSATLTGTFHRTDIQGMMCFDDRVYLLMNWRTEDQGASLPLTIDFGGLSYPVQVTNCQWIQSQCVVEINPVNGVGINLMCSDNFDSPTDSNAVFSEESKDNRATAFLVADPDGEHLCLASQYGGRRDSGAGFVHVGRNKAGTFNTRIFSTSSSGVEPYWTKLTMDLEPVVAATVAADDVLTGAVSTDSYPGKPVIDSSGKLYMTWSTPNVGEGSANLNRNPTPYASNAPNVHGDGGDLNIARIGASDYSDPRDAGNYSLSLLDITANASGTWVAGNLALSDDEASLLIALYAPNGAGTGSILGEPSSDIPTRNSWLVSAAAATGAFEWQARVSGFFTSSSAVISYVHQWQTGPHAGRIWAIAKVEGGDAGSYGANNASDDVVAYNLSDKWPHDNALQKNIWFVAVFDSAGEVVPDECFPLIRELGSFNSDLVSFEVY